ncbi:hypothetical protein [Pseudomonas sp. NBRC 111140]|uniref:hypothetical protein n=1 Tax=Pseudomonas sp. NBRC 111140 TaxID=1661055 RepID=UPI000760FF62|nr:hypothetical protein [Pseudomonas sp. NBRC 111140]
MSNSISGSATSASALWLARYFDEYKHRKAQEDALAAQEKAQACTRLRLLKQSMGLRHLVGVQLDVVDPEDYRWLQQTLNRMNAELQLEWFELAMMRAQRVTGKPFEQVTDHDMLTHLWEMLEQGHAA